ncbi:hypothetical protein LWI28_025318 [Acer negundo]|uniref:Uncharacterized protein n=1 Tax=Acer negundo TaxID=4023 RepID=A0AAD5P1E3_ACENE|nr:hypothetical protein LWI28_025318 [Acer negundo]
MSQERRRPTTTKHDVAEKATTNHGFDELGTPTNTWVYEERPASAMGLEQSTRVLLQIRNRSKKEEDIDEERRTEEEED